MRENDWMNCSKSDSQARASFRNDAQSAAAAIRHACATDTRTSLHLLSDSPSAPVMIRAGFHLLVLAVLSYLAVAEEGDRCLNGAAVFAFLKLKHVDIPIRAPGQQLGVSLEIRGVNSA